MKKIADTILILLICIVTIEATLQLLSYVKKLEFTESKVKAATKSINTIMVLGESTSYGLSLANREKEAYPYLLVEYLNDVVPNRKFELLNLSYPGQISDSVLLSMKRAILNLKPDLIICQFGVNDSSPALNPFFKYKIFGATLPHYVMQLKTVRLAFLSFLYFKEKKRMISTDRGMYIFSDESQASVDNFSYIENTKNNYQETLDIISANHIPYLMLSYFTAPDQIHDMFKELQRRNNSHYIDLDIRDQRSVDSLYSADGWHPSALGHREIFNKIRLYLKKNDSYFRLGI